MAELQIPDYMQNKPVDVASLFDLYDKTRANQQAMKMNEMKMAEEQQIAPLRQRYMQSQAAENESTASINQLKAHQQKLALGSNIAKQILGQAQKVAKEGTPEFDQAVQQYGNPMRPIMASAFGHENDPSKPIDVNSLKSLAAINMGAEDQDWVEINDVRGHFMMNKKNGEIKPAQYNDKQLQSPLYDVGNKFDLGMASSLSKLVEDGVISLEQAQSIKRQVQYQGQPQSMQPPVAQPQVRPPVYIAPNLSPQDQAVVKEDLMGADLFPAYQQGVEQQQQSVVPPSYGGIKSDVQRLQEKQNIEEAGKAPEREQALSSNYQNESKNYRDLSEAYKKTIPLFDKAKESAPATLAAVTNFMKLLDPASVVKETELAMALNATGLSDKYQNLPKTWVKGQVLTPTQVAEFKRVMTDVYKSSTAQQKQIDKNYKERAERNKLNPKNIIQDVGQYGSYKSAEEVKAAYKNGDLTIDEAKDILNAKFD